MHKQRDLSCHYSLRKNPKKKTQKSFTFESPEPMKKILFRCEQCGKGFRYEKCLTNHKTGIHLNQRVCEESIKSLYNSFSHVQKKKRSKVMRYKNTSLACSFATFLQSRSVFAEDDEELEVAESLILLSKSSPKFVSEANPETPEGCLSSKKPGKAGEFESEFLNNVQKLLKAGTESASFLGHNCELDQQKLQKAGGLGSMECCDSDAEMITESSKHQCRFCNKIFTSYQALGGHQTFHRISKSKNKKNCREGEVELEDDSVRCLVKNKEHKCNICSKHFRSFHALGGHKKCHGKKQHLKTEDDHDDLGLFSSVPVTV